MHYHSDVAFGAGGSRCALIKFSEPALTQIVFHLTTHTTLWQNHVAIGNLEFDAGNVWTSIVILIIVSFNIIAEFFILSQLFFNRASNLDKPSLLFHLTRRV